MGNSVLRTQLAVPGVKYGSEPKLLTNHGTMRIGCQEAACNLRPSPT